MLGPRTLYDKLFDQHVAARKDDDRHLIHEVSSPQAFSGLKAQGRAVRRPDLTLATCDHGVPTTPRPRALKVPQTRLQVETLARNARANKIPYMGLNSSSQGIVHVIGPELAFTLPGTTVVCGDSHTSTHGALGCLAFGIGTSEVEHVLATQTVAATKWKNMRVWVGGELGEGVGSKDLILYIIGCIGTAAGTGAAMEFAGPTIENLSMEARMSLCNMAIEAGARAGMIAPDAVTVEYLKGRPLAPAQGSWELAVECWEELRSDPGATFEREFMIDARHVVPTVSWGTSPEQVTPITGTVPFPEDFKDPAQRKSCQRALQYMGLEPGTKMTNIAIDKIFIGSCTNARLSDLRSAAGVLRGRKISPTIRAAYVVPGSGIVKQQAESEGLDKVFQEAGFEWREAGCSLCVGLNEDNLDPYERSASTTNRNFENRQGTAGRTHLVSPIMAAAAAINGRLSDVREFLHAENGLLPTHSYPDEINDDEDEFQQDGDHAVVVDDDLISAGPFTTVSGTVAPLDQANIDTDCILPKQFCTTIHRRGLRDGLFYNLRWCPDGARNEGFVLNQPPYDKASILLCTGPNFACGSSREHAVWALLDFGIRVVIAPSFADIFYNNAFKNGLLPACVDERYMDALEAEAKAGRSIGVVLRSQQILDNSGHELATFTVDPRHKQMLLDGVDEIGVSLHLGEQIDHYERERSSRWPWLDSSVTQGWDRLKLKSGQVTRAVAKLHPETADPTKLAW